MNMTRGALFSMLNKNRYLWGFAALLCVYVCNLGIDIMEIDAAQYASISREMQESGSYLEVYHRGKDYLDKPPFLFWSSALSFQLFGIHNWSYKLPALLVLLIGIYSTYRFSRLWYDEQRSRVAALVLASTQAYFLMTNDVRTDGLLTGWNMLAIWQLAAYLHSRHWRHLFVAAVSIALAMMSKGPLGLVLPGIALGGHLLLTRNYKAIFDYKWLLMLMMVALLLLPMCIGLYQQFDMHPEKEVYGLQGPSGLKFFFWTQSFGRITGENYWQNDSPVYYFLQTMLWDLQPWVLLFFPALIWVLWLLVKDGLRLKHLPEGFSVSGFVLMLVVLSASRYKLPHYVFPLFPFAAIIVAHFLYTLQEAKPALLQRVGNWFLAFQVSFILAAMAVATYLFPLKEWWAWMLIIGMGFLAYHFRKTLQGVEAIVFPVIFIAGITGMVMATAFYPALMAYQSTNTAGRWAQVHAPDADGFYFFSKGGHSLDFYAQRTVPQIFDHQLDTLQQETFIYTGVAGLAHFRSNYDGKFEVVWEAPDFTVSRLNFSFLLPNQRDQAVKAAYIMRWQPEETVH
ncbi:MAG TPA: hypothetical protein DHW15_13450 [Bacteroidetes bacterium]|jgi:4-amino-4-deoxy-L-arabinose transferase-like glycosyltransferase|nr:hypothetical protein [Bacteroidota bacterium]